VAEIGDTVGIGIRLEDDGSVGQYAQNLEDLIVRAITGAGEAVKTALKEALIEAAGTFGKGMSAAASVARGAISGIKDQTVDLQDRLASAEKSAATFAEQLDIDPDAFIALTQSAKNLQLVFDVLSDSSKDFSAVDLRRLRAEFDSLRRVSVEQLAQFQTTQSTVRTLLKAEADERRQLSRERASADKSANSLRIVQEQTSSAQIVADLKASTQERVALIQQETRRRADLFKIATATIVGLERSLRSVFEQTGKVLSGAFRGLASVAQSAAKSINSVFQRSNRQITDNYGQSLKKQEQLLQNSVNQQSGTIRKFAEQANQSLGGIGTGRFAAAGIAATLGGFLAGSLKRGFDRFSTIQEATRGLNILLGDANKSAQLLDRTLDVVRGTPFGLELFADAAAQLITFNVNAKQVPAILEAVGDAAALKGSRAPEFIGRLVDIFGRISTQARVTGDDINRLQDAGVPALAILGNSLGRTTEEIRELVSSGAVGTEAIKLLTDGIKSGTDGVNGATVAFGGLAKSLGLTLRGSIANFGSARGRLGAAIIAPFNDAFIAVVGLLTKLTDGVTKSVADLLKGLSSTGLISRFTEIVNQLSGNLEGIFERIRPLAAAAVRALIGLSAAFAGLKSARVVAIGVKVLAAAFTSLLSPLRILFAVATGISFVFTKLVRENIRFATALTFLGESVLQILRPFKEIFDVLADGTSSLRSAFSELFRSGFSVLVTFVNNVLAPALFGIGLLLRQTVVPAVEAFSDRIVKFVQSDAANQLSGLFARVLETATKFAEFIIKTVLPVLARVAAVVGGVVFVAIEQFVGLVQNRVLPVLSIAVENLKEFASVIAIRIPEAFRNFGRAISDAFSDRSFGGVAVAFKEFLLGLGPIAAVAGAAVALRFVNPFLGLGVLIAGGLAVAFGPKLLSQIQPRLNDLRQRVAKALNFENLLNIGLNVLALVNRLGRVLGRVVSDPRLIAAVAGIAAVAAALAGSFILGVIQGINDNFVKLVRGVQNIVGKALADGFKAALTNPLIGASLIGGFAALLFGPSVIANLRRASANAAVVVAQNFNNNIRRLTLQTQPLTQNASTFIQGLFGGPQALQAAAKAQVRQAQQAVSRESQRLRDIATAFGGNTARKPLTDQQVGVFVNNLITQFGELGVAGGLARNAISQIGVQIRNVARGGVRDFASLREAIRSLNFRSVNAAAQSFGVTLRVAVQNANRQLGNLGTALKTAAPALFKQAGVIAGGAFATAFASQALFDSSSSLTDKAGSAAGVAASFGATAAIAGPKVAALTTGLGLLAGVFRSVSQRAQEAKLRVEEIIAVSQQFDDPSSVQALEARIISSFENIPNKVRDRLAGSGITLSNFVDLNPEELETAFELLKNISDFAQTELGADSEISGLSELIGVDEQNIRAVIGDLTSVRDAVKDVVDANEELERVDLFGDVGPEREFLGSLSEGVREFAQNLLNVGLPLDQVRSRILQLELGVPSVVRQFSDFADELVRTGNAPLDFVTKLQELSRVRADGLRTELDKFREGLNRIDTVIDDTRANIKRLLTGELIDSSQATDAAVIAIQRIGESLEALAGKSGLAAEAEVRNVFREIAEQGANILATGIDSKEIVTKQDAEAAFQPLLQAADEIGGPVGEVIRNQLQAQLDRFSPEVEVGINLLNTSEELKKNLESSIEQVKVLVEAELVYDVTLAKENSIELAVEAAQAILDKSDLFKNVGLQLTQGLIAGFEEGQSPVVDSLKVLLDAAIQGGEDSLGIESPSRVAAVRIGFPIAEGIAQGIEEGTPLVVGRLQNIFSIVNRGFAALGDLSFEGLIAQGFGASIAEAEKRSAEFSKVVTATNDVAGDLAKVLNRVGGSAKGSAKEIENLTLVINDLQRALLQEFKIFNLDVTNPFREVIFNEGRKELNDLLTSIGGVADSFANGLREGTIAGVAQAANAFGEFEQKVIEGLRNAIAAGSIEGVDDVNRTLDQIGLVIAQQLGPDNQAAVAEFDKLIAKLRNRSDIEAFIKVEVERRSLDEAKRRLDELKAKIENFSSLVSRVINGLLAQISRQVEAAQKNLTSVLDRVLGRNQLPGGPLGLPDIGVIEDYAKKASDALTAIFDRLLGRNQLATQAITGDLDELLKTRADAAQRITIGESLIGQLKAEASQIEKELRLINSDISEAFRTFFERGSAGEAQFRAQARAIGLSAAQVEDLISKQRQLRVAQRDVSEAQLSESESSAKITEEREKLRKANIELLESSLALLDNGAEGARIFKEIADAAGLNLSEVAELTGAYRSLQTAQKNDEARKLLEQNKQLADANKSLLESSLGLINAGPAAAETFRRIARAAGLSESQISELVNAYERLSALEEQKIALELTLQQLELEKAIRDSAEALQELVDLGPEGSEFFNRLADLSGLNVDSAKNLITEYGNIVARNGRQPPSALFAGLKTFTDNNIVSSDQLIGRYANIFSVTAQSAPTSFFRSLDTQIGRTSGALSGVLGQINLLNTQLAGLPAVPVSPFSIGQQFSSTGSGSFGQQSSVVTIQNATFATPSDADRVAQVTLAAVTARGV
jgi:tape measure domain-containing protein